MAKPLSCSAYLRKKGYALSRWSKGWRAKSIVNADRNPSLYIWEHSDEKDPLRQESWYDFSASVGGDVFSLVMAGENCGFDEAVSIVGAAPNRNRNLPPTLKGTYEKFLGSDSTDTTGDALVAFGEIKQSLRTGSCKFEDADSAYRAIEEGVRHRERPE